MSTNTTPTDTVSTNTTSANTAPKEQNETKTVFSAIQPTGDLHLGNYFGAVKNWVELQNTGEHQTIYSVVDLHAMTMPYQVPEFKKLSQQMLIDLLAAGIDLDKSLLFFQSQVPEHAELFWIFACITSYGDLTRQTQFKDKSQKVSESSDGYISAGLFAYPTLQAADILLYRAGYVPVGKDQEQHLELSREIARRFNQTFGAEFFPEPMTMLTNTPKIQSLAAPEKKMSKSLGAKHYLGLFEEEASLRKKIRSAVTDSGDIEPPEMSTGVENLLGLISLCGRDDVKAQLTDRYNSGHLPYADLKDACADAVVALVNPMRERRKELTKQRKDILKMAEKRADDARDIASETIKETRRLVGLPKRYEFFQRPERKALRTES